MTEWLKCILEDNGGNPSSMRILVAFIVVIQMIGWAFVCFKTTTLPPMDWQQVATVIGALGVKAYQKGKEPANA